MIKIIAEAGVNHNGSLDLAKKLIDLASDAGADTVKFQTFRSDLLASPKAPKAVYQEATTDPAQSQVAMLKELELSESDHFEIIDHCQKREIEFLSTPFDHPSLQFLIGRLALPVIKISSGDLTNGPLLLEVAKSQTPVILSTGMGTLEDIEQALSVLAFGYLNKQGTTPPNFKAFKICFDSKNGKSALKEKVSLLHCTTEYPAPFDEINLRAMELLSSYFRLPVGLSDHSPGISIPIAAAALGAQIIEKHITLDPLMPGPDHKASLPPDLLKQMVAGIRQVELAMGKAEKIPTPSEKKNMAIARKSIVATADIKEGDIYSVGNLGMKRPGDGLSPMRYWDLLGKKAKGAVATNDQVSE